MAVLKSIADALVGVELTPYIDVNRLSTANSMPTISGTAVFNRFDSLGNPDQAIEVILNYRPYYLFEGNLGLVNTDIPGVYVWRLHVDSPLYPGTYDVEANIYSVADDQILTSDNSVNELTILNPQSRYGGQPAPAAKKSLAQKAAVVAGLMNSLSNMFGNSGVGGPSPAIHPVQDDQASSPLVGRGNEERTEDPMVKSKDQVVDRAPLPPPKHSFGATDPGSADEPAEDKDVEAPSIDQANSDLGDAKKEQEDANASQEKPQEEPPQKDPRDVPDDGRERPATPEEMFSGNPTLLAAYYKREGVSQRVAEF